MHTTLLFRSGNTLHAMYATLVLQLGISAAAFDHRDDFFQSTDSRFGTRQHLYLPALSLCVAGVHAEHFGREERGFITTGSSANFEDHVALIVGILGQE